MKISGRQTEPIKCYKKDQLTEDFFAGQICSRKGMETEKYGVMHSNPVSETFLMKYTAVIMETSGMILIQTGTWITKHTRIITVSSAESLIWI